jgi:hypothetical protein
VWDNETGNQNCRQLITAVLSKRLSRPVGCPPTALRDQPPVGAPSKVGCFGGRFPGATLRVPARMFRAALEASHNVFRNLGSTGSPQAECLPGVVFNRGCCFPGEPSSPNL